MSMVRSWLVAAGFSAALTLPSQAQRPGARDSLPRDLGAERVLGMRAQLGLTSDQIQKLEGLRKERLAARQARMSELLDLRSQVEAGDLTRDELRARLQARREELGGRAVQQGTAVRDVLTPAQREKLQELRRQAIGRRRVMAHRQWRLHRGAGFDRGRGFRGPGPRGFGPGRAGPGMGPQLRRGWGAGPASPRRPRPRAAPDSAGPRR